MKIRCRVGVSVGTVPLNGPEMYTMSTPGASLTAFGEGAESVNATDTNRVPASIGSRTSSAWSAVILYSCRICPSTSSSGTAISWPGSGPGYLPPIVNRLTSA